MSRLVVNEELGFGRVVYVGPNHDWAKVIDLQSGEKTYIHVYEHGNLESVFHHSLLPFIVVPHATRRRHNQSVPSEGTIIRFKAGYESQKARSRALVWVSVDEWLVAVKNIRRQRLEHNELLLELNLQEMRISDMFESHIQPYALFG